MVFSFFIVNKVCLFVAVVKLCARSTLISLSSAVLLQGKECMSKSEVRNEIISVHCGKPCLQRSLVDGVNNRRIFSMERWVVSTNRKIETKILHTFFLICHVF